MFEKRILIADDDETFLLSTADLLKREGYKCDCVEDVSSAIEKLNEVSYDLIISDIRIPGNTEFEFLDYLSESELKIPIILVTGYPSAYQTGARKLSVMACLPKPFQLEELLDFVRKVK